MKHSSYDAVLKKRTLVLFFFFAGALTLLGGRLFVLQILNHQEYVALAAKQHRLVSEISYERGGIYAQDKVGGEVPLAITKLQKDVIASPRQIKDPEGTATLLASQLGIGRETILAKLSKKDDAYEIIAKKVDAKVTKPLEDQKIAGITFNGERRRFYPQGNLSAHVLGFVSMEKGNEETGKYGLEQFYNKVLSGTQGLFDGFRDAAGFWIALGKQATQPAKNGSSLVLTIDYNIQRKAEEILSQVKEEWSSPEGIIMVMDPKTGKILALAANPTFEPANFFSEKDLSVFLDPAVQSVYELGSVMKPITMAAGIEEKLVHPNTTYTDTGAVTRSGYTIKNYDEKAHGVQTMTNVLEQSLNTGAVFVSDLLGPARQRKYFDLFGFGQKSGVDLSGEVSGSLANLNHGRPINFATAAFGQGISATPLQMANAIGALANDGKLMRPYIVEKIVSDSGKETVTEPEVVQQAVSRQTAETLTKMLVSVVRNGYTHRAGVNGYFVAGKTGTAQIPRTDGKGYSSDYIHTMVGYAPAFDPKFLVYIQLNQPRGNAFASNTLAIAFHDLTEYILQYYQIPPEEK